MRTSDERREVAERLREYGNDTLKDGSPLKTLKDVTGTDSWRHVLLALADLIDPTCHLVETIKNEWPDGSTTYLHRLSCGHMYETIHRSSPVFCPYCGARLTNCGARVVRDDD